MKNVSFLAFAFIFCAGSAYASLTNKEIETLFDGDQHCTNSGTSYGFSFYDINGKYQGATKPYVVKEKTGKGAATRECIQNTSALSGAVAEKNECEAHVVVFPKVLSNEEARFLFSEIHTNPVHTSLLRPAFDTSTNPMVHNKEDWNKLIADYALIRKKVNEGLSAEIPQLVKNYSVQYTKSRNEYLAQKNIRPEEVHIARIQSEGCD